MYFECYDNEIYKLTSLYSLEYQAEITLSSRYIWMPVHCHGIIFECSDQTTVLVQKYVWNMITFSLHSYMASGSLSHTYPNQTSFALTFILITVFNHSFQILIFNRVYFCQLKSSSNLFFPKQSIEWIERNNFIVGKVWH